MIWNAVNTLVDAVLLVLAVVGTASLLLDYLLVGIGKLPPLRKRSSTEIRTFGAFALCGLGYFLIALGRQMVETTILFVKVITKGAQHVW